jgi:hypothetical protein
VFFSHVYLRIAHIYFVLAHTHAHHLVAVALTLTLTPLPLAQLHICTFILAGEVCQFSLK